ncbi:hypothetical protein HY500_02785 [Candidatus Woesearchaeota archaeon]|nr:hypothetical protein [Candidatus Woesearchaeota archaeon]
MKQSMRKLGNMILVSTSPLWGLGSLIAAVENLKIESREYRDIGNATVEVHRLRDGEVRVYDRPHYGGIGYSYLVDSDGDGKLDYRRGHSGGVNFASGVTKTRPTEEDSRLYDRLLGQ